MQFLRDDCDYRYRINKSAEERIVPAIGPFLEGDGVRVAACYLEASREGGYRWKPYQEALGGLENDMQSTCSVH